MEKQASELLSEMKHYLLPSDYWSDWLRETGEPPPDLDRMPSVPHLPDPFDFLGHRITQKSEWRIQRKRILEAYKYYIMGTYPPPPGNIIARTLSEQKLDHGGVRKEIELKFGPGHKARLRLELLIPKLGKEKLPVFMTQRTHSSWSRIAAARGYIGVSYDACDSADDSQEYMQVWPEHDWTRLTRRAWAAGRALDYLHTLPYVDKRHACITGHSRNGKLSITCGAIDDRFDVVIPSSSGSGGVSPWRFSSFGHFSEGIGGFCNPMNCEWFHPRSRFFTGREDKLPVDANLLVALSAPRAVLISSAKNDCCDNLKAVEMGYRSASKVWDLLGSPGKLRILLRFADHETRAEEIERYVDWCDLHFGRARGNRKQELLQSFDYEFSYPYQFSEFKKHDKASKARPATTKDKIRFLLGEEPGCFENKNGTYGVEPPHISAMLRRILDGERSAFSSFGINFGQYIPGTVYIPGTLMKRVFGSATLKLGYGESPVVDVEGKHKIRAKVPLLIWLQPESISWGYSGKIGWTNLPAPMLRAGFATFAFDAIGNGYRIDEGTDFYKRYPRWSLMGKMVKDAISAVDAALQIRFVDPKKIFLVGFGMGGTAAILAAALDKRVAGVAATSGFSPLKTDTLDKPTGGLARYALWDCCGLMPRLGFFVKDPTRLPVDFDDILASIAPRHLFLVTPKVDCEVNHEDVLNTVEEVKKAYGAKKASARLWHYEPLDYRQYSRDIQEKLYEAMHRIADI